MSARPILTLTAGVALLAAVAPAQARSLSATYEPTFCVPCYSGQEAASSVVVTPYRQRVAAFNEVRRPFTRFDIEGLRAFTRMR
ncbi:hypothetical protein [Methylobacterium mesophilicum]